MHISVPFLQITLLSLLFFFVRVTGVGRRAGGGRARLELVAKSLAAGMGSVSDDLHPEQTVRGWCRLCILTCPNNQ